MELMGFPPYSFQPKNTAPWPHAATDCNLQAGAHLHHAEPQGGIQRLGEGQTHHAFLEIWAVKYGWKVEILGNAANAPEVSWYMRYHPVFGWAKLFFEE